MKVGVELMEWSENLKDEEGHLAKNKGVGKLIKLEAICYEICKTVSKNFPDLWLTHNSVGNSMVVITHAKSKPASFATCHFFYKQRSATSAMLPSREIGVRPFCAIKHQLTSFITVWWKPYDFTGSFSTAYATVQHSPNYYKLLVLWLRVRKHSLLNTL